MNILWAILILLGIGLVLGLGLAIAAKVLYVKEDERIDEVAKRLPNYNCGSCGYPGCKGLAEAIVKGKETSLRKCKPGKEDANFKPIIEYLNEHPNDDGTKVNVHL
jgi:electron transport complex protein RnfB